MSRGQIFKSVSMRKPRVNAFDLSHEKKLTCNMASLVPIYLQETLPGDKFRVNTELLIKLAPMIAPVYHRINAYVHYFFVPNRLIWDNWQTFITGGVDGQSAPTHPFITINAGNASEFSVGSLADYLGIPPVQGALSTGQNINALPFRAYQLIYDEYYRDQTLTPEVLVNKGDGLSSDASLLVLRNRQWEKDYFTSALTTPQRGADVNIPLDVEYQFPAVARKGDGSTLNNEALETYNAGQIQGATSDSYASVENIESIGATINDLRTSIRLQEWLEKNARAGARYVEQILAHFGKRVPDYTLQRPQYLGGGKQPITISEVLANFESADVPQGKMSGHGLSVGNGAGFTHRCDEHGIIIGILSILPRTAYYQGIPKFWRKKIKFDYAFPEFANLGEEQVFTDELYVDYATDDNSEVFGYQSRYATYKYVPDSIHGEFRTSLEFWHLARKFGGRPLLNNSFTEATTDNRIFAVQDESVHKLWINLYHDVKAIRPLPVYGTPIL